MAAPDIDAYLAELDADQRRALEELRRAIRELLPEAEETISYGMPAFTVRGRVVAGFAAFTKHLAYLPHSGSVLPALSDELASYQRTKSSLHFHPDAPLPPELLRKLIATRLQELGFELPSEA